MVERNQRRLRKFEMRQKVWSEYVLLRDKANNNGVVLCQNSPVIHPTATRR